MATSPSSQYLRNAVMTAPPEKLQLMLYDGAIRFAAQGRDAMAAGRIEDAYNLLTRAERIILELQNGLRPEIHPQLCANMSALYTFIYRKLVDGCVRKDVACIDDALKVLQYQRETWVLLLEKLGCLLGDGKQGAVEDQKLQTGGLALEC